MRECKGVRRCPVLDVYSIDLVRCGTAEEKPEVADHLVRLDALEDEGGARIEASGIATVRLSLEDHSLETDSDELARTLAALLPCVAQFACGAQEHFAWLGSPEAGRGRAAADLDHMRLLPVDACNHPEPVPAQVHQAPACLKKGLERADHGGCRVLRVCPRQDDAVRTQQVHPLVMQILIGQGVVAVAFRLEPVEQAEVGPEAVWMTR